MVIFVKKFADLKVCALYQHLILKNALFCARYLYVLHRFTGRSLCKYKIRKHRKFPCLENDHLYNSLLPICLDLDYCDYFI